MPDIDINEMTDEEFIAYIEGVEADASESFHSGNEPPAKTSQERSDWQALTAADESPNANESMTEAVSSDTSVPTETREFDGAEGAEYDKGLADGRNARLISHIKSLYPDMDEGAAIEQFLDDADRDEAEAAGLTLEDYRNEKAEQAEFADFKAERERKRQNDEAVAGIVERWKADSERMKGILPEFDFEKAMQNGQFRDKVIKEGKDIITAYFELNPINKAPAASQRRDIEVGDMSGGISGGFKSPFDVERASEEEFSRYISRILDK